ncbi:MAG: 30S ribosomal protein S16 [Bacteroidetes bacterium]|nr:30S ribosomal protein S16 [Bacteroidota bacterium]
MPVKIRLQRQGRKKKPFYHIVIADSRAPRDGKYIERLGIYNPNTNPATIEINFDRALSWLQKGAQPTDTCRAILSYNGVLYKNHLLNGVRKGAFDEATAEVKFNEWKTQKDAKILTNNEELATKKQEKAKKRLDAEIKINEERAQEIAKRNSELVAEVEAKAKEEEDAKAEANKKVEVKPEVEPKAEPKAEVKTEESVKKDSKEEPKTEV